MAVKIRLARHGAKKNPYYRVVVADARARRDGRFIEQVGRYNPCTDPTFLELDLDKVDSWVKNGAQATERVARLIERARKATDNG
ncbi:MAG: 30S ribosomal protein S16 [Actinomycetia bacterium]|nr:30S ribosomal protein S16 [Actinomycetes bacterium]